MQLGMTKGGSRLLVSLSQWLLFLGFLGLALLLMGAGIRLLVPRPRLLRLTRFVQAMFLPFGLLFASVVVETLDNPILLIFFAAMFCLPFWLLGKLLQHEPTAYYINWVKGEDVPAMLKVLEDATGLKGTLVDRPPPRPTQEKPLLVSRVDPSDGIWVGVIRHLSAAEHAMVRKAFRDGGFRDLRTHFPLNVAVSFTGGGVLLFLVLGLMFPLLLIP